MSVLWAIDPAHGKPHAMAVFVGGTLAALTTIDPKRPRLDGMPASAARPDTIAVERPVCYPRSKTPPNDIVDLAWDAAVLAGWLTLGGTYPGRELVVLRPAEWKGQVSKPIHHSRIWRVLTAGERALFPAATEAKIEDAKKALAHGRTPSYRWSTSDLLDAAGLGLFVLGRTRRGG